MKAAVEDVDDPVFRDAVFRDAVFRDAAFGDAASAVQVSFDFKAAFQAGVGHFDQQHHVGGVVADETELNTDGAWIAISAGMGPACENLNVIIVDGASQIPDLDPSVKEFDVL